MSDRGGAAGIERQGPPAPVTRIIGWSMLGVLAAFLINNVLIVGFGFTGPESIVTGKSTSIVPILLYAIAIGISVYYVLRTPDTSLRWDAHRIHMANVYIIRSFFFAALFVTGIFVAGPVDNNCRTFHRHYPVCLFLRTGVYGRSGALLVFSPVPVCLSLHPVRRGPCAC